MNVTGEEEPKSTLLTYAHSSDCVHSSLDGYKLYVDRLVHKDCSLSGGDMSYWKNSFHDSMVFLLSLIFILHLFVIQTAMSRTAKETLVLTQCFVRNKVQISCL